MSELTDATATIDDLTCREVVALVTMYLEGALTPDDRGRFERHLKHCVGCRRYLAQMRRTIALTGGIREGDLSAEAREELVGVFRGWRQTEA